MVRKISILLFAQVIFWLIIMIGIHTAEQGDSEDTNIRNCVIVMVFITIELLLLEILLQKCVINTYNIRIQNVPSILETPNRISLVVWVGRHDTPVYRFTGQQRMLTPPQHLILPSHLSMAVLPYTRTCNCLLDYDLRFTHC